jgi:hypothetical protein
VGNGIYHSLSENTPSESTHMRKKPKNFYWIPLGKRGGGGGWLPFIIFNSKIKELEISISNKVNTLQS